MTVFEMLRKLLNRREKRNVVLLFFAILGTAVAETAGVGAVLPFMSLATNPNLVTSDARYAAVYNLFGRPPIVSFVLLVGILVIIILVLGNAFSALTQFGIIRYAALRGFSLSRRLFREYLSRPYEFYLSTNTAELSRNVLTEVNNLVKNLLLPFLEVTSRFIVALSIVGFLFALNPSVALAVVVVLGGMYGTVYALSRSKLRELGADRLAANRGRFKATSEAFNSIKDIKLYHTEGYFDGQFSEHANIFARRESSSSIIGSLPRYALEAIAFSGVVVLVLLFAHGNGGVTSAIPFISAYAVGSYKLMPALQGIIRDATRIRYNSPSLSVVTNDLAYATGELPPIPLRLQRSPLIEFEDVDYVYPNREAPAVHGINFIIAPNTRVGIVGETGSGKTTLVDILIGLLQPQKGAVLADGVTIDESNVRAWQAKVGYVPQMISLLDDTVTRNIAFGVETEMIDMNAVLQAARMARIDTFIKNELPDGYETGLGERGLNLSGGQRQRIGIARALYRNPDVLVFDEATSALDNLTEHAVMDAINMIGHTKTIVIVAHRLTTVENCDMIVVMDKGRIAGTGAYDELLGANDVFRSIAKLE